VRYDAATLRKEDGKGKWWEGLDPQELYTGPPWSSPTASRPSRKPRSGTRRMTASGTSSPGDESGFHGKMVPALPGLVDKYRPDLLYFDNFALPLGQTGLDIAAHYYNASRAWHDGRPEAVLNIKGVSPERRGAVIDDIERGVAEASGPPPGRRHLHRLLALRPARLHRAQVQDGRPGGRMLVDIVSKNGNLLLSVPCAATARSTRTRSPSSRHGQLDRRERRGDLRHPPVVVYGEGPSVVEKAEAGHFGGARDVRSKPYTAEDLRFTTKPFDSAQGGVGRCTPS